MCTCGGSFIFYMIQAYHISNEDRFKLRVVSMVRKLNIGYYKNYCAIADH